MKKLFPEMPMCDYAHKPHIQVYCKKCAKWVCDKCRELHLDHEGMLKDLEELTNQNLLIYAEHLKQLKIFFKKCEEIPSTKEYDSVKTEVAGKITAAYTLLITQLNNHKDAQIKKVTDAVEYTKKKRQRIDGYAKAFRDTLEEVLDAIRRLKKCDINMISKNYLLEYNNTARVKFHEAGIEEVKEVVEKLDKIYDEFFQFKTLEIKTQLKDTYISKLIQIPLNHMNEPRIMLIEPKTRNIIIANVDTKKKRQITLNNKTFKFPNHFEFLEVKNKLIVCGGSNEFNHCLSNTYKIILESKEVRELTNMEIAKKYHALTALSKQVIYSIGGLGNYGALKTCEYLNLKGNKWTMQSPLNEPREGPSACVLGEKFIYCIGGRGNDEELFNSIEVLDVSFPKLGWSLIELDLSIWKPTYFGLSIAIDNKHILISGGINEKQIIVAETYILDAKEYKLEQIEKMKAHDCFLERDKRVIKGKVYAIGHVSYDIHIFDIEKKKWDIMKSNISEESKSN